MNWCFKVKTQSCEGGCNKRSDTVFINYAIVFKNCANETETLKTNELAKKRGKKKLAALLTYADKMQQFSTSSTPLVTNH